MKKIITVLAISISTITMSIASNIKTLTNEIKEKVTLDINGDKIDKNNQSFITVSFKIINGKVKIEEINGSNSHEF